MDVSLMIEGQMGLDWPRWQRLCTEAERLGFAGLYRSDHFFDPRDPPAASLELVTSLTSLAASTERLRFGALVAPVSFRDPVMFARQGASIATLSDGRYIHGLGAGWFVPEHEAYGFALGDIPTRIDRLAEALEVTRLLLHGDGPVSFEGRFFHMRDARPASPRPERPVPICIGGKGPKRVLPLVARYADVWNATALSLEDFRARNARLDQLLAAEGRDAAEVRRTVMTWVPIDHGEARAQLDALADAGCEEVMVQRAGYDALDDIAAIAEVAFG